MKIEKSSFKKNLLLGFSLKDREPWDERARAGSSICRVLKEIR